MMMKKMNENIRNNKDGEINMKIFCQFLKHFTGGKLSYGIVAYEVAPSQYVDPIH
jgi:hypothetical protein